MKLYVMRHGRTNFNDLGLCNDDPGRDVHLTATGIAQAEEAAERLGVVALDRIFCSELPRTRQTAAVVNRRHGVPIVPHPALNDIRTGFDGRPVAEYFAATAADPLAIRIGGGENLRDHKARVVGFIDWLRGEPDRAVLVVAHEETLRVFEARLRGGVPDEGLRDLHFANCQVLEYTLTP